MCQAYAGEKALITWGEDCATIAGFAAASKGIPKSANPYNRFERYNRDAWDHGWACWHERILPWALEQQYHQDGRITEARKACELFKLTRELPADLQRFLPD
ncbi:MAG: hypothetical protein Q8P76_03830 [bacterium]|nr:hypothetical protein [bacterium]